jgi:hypothetical protein
MVKNLLWKLVSEKSHLSGLSVIFMRFSNVTKSILHKANTTSTPNYQNKLCLKIYHPW